MGLEEVAKKLKPTFIIYRFLNSIPAEKKRVLDAGKSRNLKICIYI